MEYKMKGGMGGMGMGGMGMGGMPQLPRAAPYLLLIPGLCLCAFGLLLFFNEWLLRWIVAGLFLVVGGLLTLIGLRTKKMMGV